MRRLRLSYPRLQWADGGPVLARSLPLLDVPSRCAGVTPGGFKMYKKILILPAAFLAFACGGNDKKVDEALNSDLSTAAQANPYTPLDSITAAERARTATTAPAPTALRSTATAPRTVYRAPVRRTTTTRRSSSSGTYSSAPVYSAPAPQP